MRKIYKVLCKRDDFNGFHLDEEYVIKLYLTFDFVNILGSVLFNKLAKTMKEATLLFNLKELSQRTFFKIRPILL